MRQANSCATQPAISPRAPPLVMQFFFTENPNGKPPIVSRSERQCIQDRQTLSIIFLWARTSCATFAFLYIRLERCGGALQGRNTVVSTIAIATFTIGSMRIDFYGFCFFFGCNSSGVCVSFFCCA